MLDLGVVDSNGSWGGLKADAIAVAESVKAWTAGGVLFFCADVFPALVNILLSIGGPSMLPIPPIIGSAHIN